MDSAQKLIQAFASLLWPLIALLVLLLFKPAVAAIIESAKSRKFTLKIGGQELTMEEANQVQQKLIADLQTKVSEIDQKLAGVPEVFEPSKRIAAVEPSSSAAQILWVDAILRITATLCSSFQTQVQKSFWLVRHRRELRNLTRKDSQLLSPIWVAEKMGPIIRPPG